jgi:transcription-repair coupling factor (superfamily II helicase)
VDVVGTIAADEGIQRAARALCAGRRVVLRGSQGSSAALVAGALARIRHGPVLLVVAHLDDTDDAVDELSGLMAERDDAEAHVVRLPALEILPGESSVSMELFAERLRAVRAAIAMKDKAGASVVVASIAALMQPVPAESLLANLSRMLVVNQRLDLGELSAWLSRAGYERVEAVEEPGQFAMRGDIVDVFPPVGAGSVGGAAVRLDVFGDVLERLTEIDLDTMASDRAIERVELVCADLEGVLALNAPARATTSAASGTGSAGGGVRAGAIGGRRGAAARRHDEGAAASGAESVGIDATGGAGAVSFLEYLPSETLVVLHETMEITEQGRGYFERLTDPRIFGPPAVMKRIEQRFGTGTGAAERVGGIVEIAQFSGARAATDEMIELPVGPLVELPADAGEAVAALGAMTQSAQVVVLCQNGGELSRLSELIDVHAPGAKGRISARVAFLHRGFVWGESAGAVVVAVPYHEMLRRFDVRRRGGGGDRGASASARTSAAAALDPKLRAGRAIDTFLDFGPGEYVVHRDHGIAVFRGLAVMKPREVKAHRAVVLPGDQPVKRKRRAGAPEVDPDEGLEEFLTLEFAGAAKMHVPATKIDQVQRYVGGFRGSPQLSTIGGQRWKKQKESVAESVKDLAGELLRVRAARESMPGLRYPLDTAWQREFEAEFPFQETEDQLAALGEIKRDMHRERPMDRLLCGDVGFGKTEVAIRAAFKAAEFGKQVAVLVPTTVLAEQHERTFGSRFRDYPFKVASISRFKTTQEVNAVLADLRKGQVDVIIGTHRLLSKDVKFNDLGLVIIDEEQRFGVEHKERLLALRLTVDVLTLSATPIPRTLHMSMLGLRDISSLTTAPVDRRAVVTEVIPFNPRRIQQAIQRELARDGQVFFVHNRVHNIQSVADDLYKLVPGARIVIGHGQMPDGELEEVMLTFMRRKADILVSTTIIESGIDIPTANTMFINDADRFGLAELHQLRGRVGRYKHRAYCYMLLSPDKTVTEKAVKRLKAIEEYSMLGAGFKIAMRDLEIRGAGNILGPEQSGHIATVGYEMYCQLLERAVKTLRNEPTAQASETSVEIGISGLIPKRYIPSDGRRMGAYRRLALAQTREELERIEAEIKEAYGPSLPSATRRLIDLALVRVEAARLQVRSIAVREKDVLFRLRLDDGAELAERLKDPAGVQRSMQSAVTLLPPPSGETLCEVYFRPPATYFEPMTLLRVLTKRLAGRDDAAAITSPGRERLG